MRSEPARLGGISLRGCSYEVSATAARDGSARWGDFHYAFIWNFLSHCKKLVASTQKDCFDHGAFKREILYFQYGFQKATTISFHCIQHHEYDHCFFYSFATSWDFTYISFTYIRFYLSGSTRHSHLKSNLERIPKIRMRFKEKSIPPCRAGPPAHVHMTNFHLT